jgi:hypothetical protein
MRVSPNWHGSGVHDRCIAPRRSFPQSRDCSWSRNLRTKQADKRQTGKGVPGKRVNHVLLVVDGAIGVEKALAELFQRGQSNDT